MTTIDSERGVRCDKCGIGCVYRELVIPKPGDLFHCPNCKSADELLFDDMYDNCPWDCLPEPLIDTAIRNASSIDRTAKPKKDMRVPSFEEKEAERERLRAAVAKEMGWST